MLRDGALRAPRPLYLLGYICDQPYFLIVVWTQRCSPTHLHCSVGHVRFWTAELNKEPKNQTALNWTALNHYWKFSSQFHIIRFIPELVQTGLNQLICILKGHPILWYCGYFMGPLQGVSFITWTMLRIASGIHLWYYVWMQMGQSPDTDHHHMSML